jgi:hypothetical protein
MKNKPDPALLGGSYQFKEIKKVQQNHVRLSFQNEVCILPADIYCMGFTDAK